jgi:flagellar hook-length control protein FliK
LKALNNAGDAGKPTSINAGRADPNNAAQAINNGAATSTQGQSQNTLIPDGAKDDSFDYIDYVTALADFTGKGVGRNEATSEELDTKSAEEDFQQSLFISTNASLSDAELQAMNALSENGSISQMSEESASNKETKTLELTIPINELVDSEQERKIALTISNEDLQMFYDAKQNMENGKADLLPGERAGLQRTIADLASQLETLAENDSQFNESSTTDANKELLESLLLGEVINDKEGHLNAGSKAELSALDEKTRLVADALANAQTTPKGSTSELSAKLASNVVNELTIENAAISNESGAGEQDNIVAQSKVGALPNDAGANLTTGQAVPKQTNDNKKLEVLSSALMNVAELNEQQSKVALESLTQRLQAVVSEMTGENKGNEFIAALQSGVKEFKQQLAQGREPGIDLKAIVAEALAQISGESGKTQQPKIDAAVNQFNAVLQLASAVNYSATQQQAQGLGISDSQLAKEINFAHVEGTKLANGIQNQMTTQASVDKAVNIFKQEGQQQLAEKVRWMVNARSATAEIRLDPADLGGINIKINLSGDTAQVNFNVQSAAAKDALDQAAPRLREMLQDQGIELGQSFVQQDSQGGQQHQPSGDDASIPTSAGQRPSMSNADVIEDEVQGMVEQRISNGAIGGIDYYA